MDTDGMVPQPGETTGRTLVLFEDGASAAGIQTVQEAMRPESSAAGDESAPAGPGVHYFATLGVAVVDAPPEQVHQAGVSAAEASIAIVEPERIVYALEAAQATSPAANGHAAIPIPDPPPFRAPAPPQSGPFSAEYLRGYREAVLHLTAGIAAESSAGVAAVAAALDETQATWGLQATKVVNSLPDRPRRAGRGARHRLRPDPPGLPGADDHHRSRSSPARRSRTGTDTGRTASARRSAPNCPPVTARATGSPTRREIFAGKVLSNAGSGGDAGILAGIELGAREHVRT